MLYYRMLTLVMGPSLLPNNLALARLRLNLLKRRFIKDENLHEAYCKSVQDYIDKGFVRRVTPEEEKREHAWFIPHHAVINPNKPGKTRVVFDCSAKYKGVSLNDNLPQPQVMQQSISQSEDRFLDVMDNMVLLAQNLSLPK